MNFTKLPLELISKVYAHYQYYTREADSAWFVSRVSAERFEAVTLICKYVSAFLLDPESFDATIQHIGGPKNNMPQLSCEIVEMSKIKYKYFMNYLDRLYEFERFTVWSFRLKR